MQRVAEHPTYISPLFSEFDRAYALTSERTQRNSLFAQVFDYSFKELFDLFDEYGDAEYHVGYSAFKNVVKIPFPKARKTIIICCSGGKDSLATILHYKKKRYRVILYHLKGINLTYKDEWKSVEKIAEVLKLPLVTEEIKLVGRQEWVEHPMKNMILANMALQYGIKNNLTTKIAFGNFSTSSLDSDPFEVCGGDCAEMWDVYQNIMRRLIPDFRIFTPLHNFQDTIDALLEKPDLLKYTQSCIGAYRYREYLHKNNEEKYNIQLPPHNCGSCWKCCLEYCVFCDNGVYEYNEEYYKHCLDILRKTLRRENGEKYSINEVFDHYFFYSREKSKYLGKIAS